MHPTSQQQKLTERGDSNQDSPKQIDKTILFEPLPCLGDKPGDQLKLFSGDN
jgi:hypothetical protein